MSVVVSGGTGFVGRFIVEHLMASGFPVAVMGRRPPPADFFTAPVRFIEASLDAERDQTAAFIGAEAFVHAAFDHLPGRYRGGEGDDPAGFRRRNLDGSIALFEQAVQAGVGRIVFLSSRAVYGARQAGVVLDEEMRPQPDTLYGEVKLEVEEALAALSLRGTRGVSLRVTGVYGPAGRGRDHKWSGLFADYLAGREVAPRIASEVHGADVARAVSLVLGEAGDGVRGRCLNVSDLVLDRRDLLAMVKAATGSSCPLCPPAQPSSLSVMDTRRLEALGWRPGGEALLARTVPELLAASEPG